MTNDKLVTKYLIKAPSDYQGNVNTHEIMQWINSWKDTIPTLKLLIFYGRAGTGKTSLAMSLCKGTLPIHYTNASDVRSKAEIYSILRLACSNTTRKNCLFILDEVEDLTYITKDILYAINPIIIITNNYHDLPDWMRHNKSQIKEYQFKAPSFNQRLKYASSIMQKEGIFIEADAKEVASKSLSFRDVLNNIDIIMMGGNIVQGYKDQTSFDTLALISMGMMSGDTEMNPSQLALWLFDNSINMEKNIDLIAHVDRLLKLSFEEQNFRMWKYAYPLLFSCRGCGVSFPYSLRIRADKKEKSEDEDIITLKDDKSTVDAFSKNIPKSLSLTDF